MHTLTNLSMAGTAQLEHITPTEVSFGSTENYMLENLKMMLTNNQTILKNPT